jgi:murein DD-endopeptidase MepM/ murein hydrolase activator NlpD
VKLTATVQAVLARRRTASQGKSRIRTRWFEWKKFWENEWNAVSHKRLYLASAVSLAVLFGASYAALSKIETTTQWKQVYTNGTYVGMVPNDPNVIQAIQQIALGYHVDVRFHSVNTHVPSDYDWTLVASLPTQAVAITLNGSPIAYIKDEQSARSVLNRVRSALTPKFLAASNSAHFVGNVSFSPTIVSAATVMSEEAAVRYILHPNPQALPGRSGMVRMLLATSDQPVSANSSQPLLQVAAEQTVTKVVSIPYSVKYVPDNHLGAGSVSVVTKGQPGQAKEQIRLKYVNGRLVAQTVVHKEIVRKPVAEVARKGTNRGIADGSWIWPSPSYVITSPYGWRSLGGGEFHPGVDIGCPIGTPVYATNNGVVEDAGWNSGGYGIWVKINNGNGIETVFGHLSRVTVHAGQTVAKGQIIGYSGSTGEATGPHLHYEVRKYGHHISPTPYM